MQFKYPFQIDDKKGISAQATEDDHIRQMIEQVLFTIPGERVNRPDFGSGINQLVFAANSDELATATQFLVQGSLQQWLGNLINVTGVQVQNEDSKLFVTVQYMIKRNQQNQVAQFVKVV